jgi:hypothetical protein
MPCQACAPAVRPSFESASSFPAARAADMSTQVPQQIRLPVSLEEDTESWKLAREMGFGVLVGRKKNDLEPISAYRPKAHPNQTKPDPKQTQTKPNPTPSKPTSNQTQSQANPKQSKPNPNQTQTKANQTQSRPKPNETQPKANPNKPNPIPSKPKAKQTQPKPNPNQTKPKANPNQIKPNPKQTQTKPNPKQRDRLGSVGGVLVEL